jgi:hypothetical protein
MNNSFMAAVTTRLSALISSMGDASMRASEGEVLLCLLPFPEPKDIMERIRNAHPKVKIIYRSIYFKGGISNVTESPPDGQFDLNSKYLCLLV